MSEWQRKILSFEIAANRTGWRGAWDAVKAAVTGNKRLTVSDAITVSWYQSGQAMHSVQVKQGVPTRER